MKKVYQIIEFIYRKAVVLFSVAALSVLFLMSIISTCFISSDQNEVTFFCRDSILINLITIILFVGALFAFSKSGYAKRLEEKLIDDNYFKWTRVTMLGIIMLIGLLWVVGTQYVPGSDQLDVMSSAYKLYIGETNMMEPGGYLDRWSNQVGLAMIEYYMCKLVGYYNFLFIQVLNVFGIIFLYNTLVDIWDDLGASKLAQVGILLSGILFFPFIMYASFVYGTVWSLTLAVMAAHAELKFFDDYKIRHLIWCAFSMGLAYQVKNNVLIMFIAMIIYGIMRILKDKEHLIKGLVLIATICVTVLVFDVTPRYMITRMTGYSLNQGVSSWSFIAMGLQDEEHAPGWNNGYNYSTYVDNGCITEVQEGIVKEEIANRISVFSDDNGYAFRFFTMKVASMWNEPTYQGFWINQIRNHRVNFAAWIELFMSAKGYTIVARMMKFFQVFVYSGALLWLLLEKRDDFTRKSFFVLCFVGGFIFHMFWEAKSQYSITYVVLLIPCAVLGYGMLIKCLLNEKSPIDSIFVRVNFFAITVSLVAFISFSTVYLKGDTGFLTADSDIYDVYIEEWVAPYTAESVLDINVMKAEKKNAEEVRDYYRSLLEQNGIAY